MARSAALAKRPATPAGFPASVVEELDRLEQQAGGRQRLVGLLALAPLNDDLRYVLGLLGAAQSKVQSGVKGFQPQQSLAEICEAGNILPGDLLRHLGSAALLRGQTLALQAVGDGLAAVASDVLKHAAPYEERCETCQGTGATTQDPTPAEPNPSPQPCPDCKGAGALRYEADPDRQKLALEMGRMLPKGGGGINILNQQLVAGGGGGGTGQGTLEKLQALSDRILYDDPAPEGSVEAEVLE